MHTSTFTELVQMLKGTQTNWVVSSETEETGSEKPWQAQLSFVDGRVTVCHVWHKADGRSLFGDVGAINWLKNLPSIRWTLERPTPHEALPQAKHGSQAVLSSSLQVPQWFRQVEQRMVPSLSRKQRQVFALVDGTRSAERIAAIFQPVEGVVNVLHDLETMGVIKLE